MVERLARALLGLFIVSITLGCALFNKSIYHLFVKKKDSIKYGLIQDL